MQISNILQQSAGMAVPNHTVRLSLFTADAPMLQWGPVRTARSAVKQRYYRSSHVVIRAVICITFKYTCFPYCNTSIRSFLLMRNLYILTPCATGAVYAWHWLTPCYQWLKWGANGARLPPPASTSTPSARIWAIAWPMLGQCCSVYNAHHNSIKIS